jgi:hypothetical protein
MSHFNRRGEQKEKFGLQVISAVGCQQKFAKLLKRFTVGA